MMSAEVIIKQSFLINCTEDVPYAVPEILLLGNREGLERLGHFLLNMSQRLLDQGQCELDPDDHQHLTINNGHFNPRLSDEMEIRIGVLTLENRDSVLEKYDIDESTRQTGDLAPRFRNLADRAEKSVKKTTEHL
ncbi:MAG: hypothetical protein O2955_04145 [Planctomycetota bacterium]|nr:hypothetical protein [Planctomycetota bacterium]MDA1211680.1 hypothetical protein [Planctomycetota bacterium]